MMAAASSVFGGIVLIAVGLYQWTLKNACLRYCQSPLMFISRYGGFRPHAQGSIVLGIRHGTLIASNRASNPLPRCTANVAVGSIVRITAPQQQRPVHLKSANIM
jgi:hypothetical protein